MTQPPTKFLSSQGYSIIKSSVSDKVLNEVKKDLSVSPNTPLDYQVGPPKKFKLYQEGPTKIYMPKFYGISKFGNPDVMKIKGGDPINVKFEGALRPEQMQGIDAFLKASDDGFKSGGLLNLTCASGKCLGKNTPILMLNGKCKKVQDVQVGDFLMGDDATSREVISTCKGTEAMYKVIQDNGINYTCNESHILSLMYNGNPVDICVSDYLNAPDKSCFLGYKKIVEIETNIQDNSTCKYWYELGFALDMKDSEILDTLDITRINSKTNVYMFLKGLFDRHEQNLFIDIALSTYDDIFNNMIFMLTYVGAEYYIYNLDCSKYSVIVLEDLCSINEWNRIDTIVYPIMIVPIGEGDYYGFEIKGNNRRFLLGDFTVTHNTVMAIYLICALKQKSIVVVHKDFLLQQWKERIGQFAPDARVGLIKAKVVDVDNKDIVIASLQSLSMKEYNADVFSGFGLCVFDEVHHTSAEVFSRALKKLTLKYTLGLSATIKRKDGLSKVFKWYLGDILYSNVKSKKKDVVKVICKYFYDPCQAYSGLHHIGGGKLNVSRMINNICEYQPRADMLIESIKEVLDSEPNRRIIILSDRRAHLENIGFELRKKHGYDVGYYLGGMKQEDLKESEGKTIILGTFCMVSEGFDCKKLDTLVLASPKSDVIQSVGRILREEAINRKHVPLVIDIIDQFSLFEKQAMKRLKYYTTQKFCIEGAAMPKDNKLVKLDGPCFAHL